VYFSKKDVLHSAMREKLSHEREAQPCERSSAFQSKFYWSSHRMRAWLVSGPLQIEEFNPTGLIFTFLILWV
jgi:hypothetical protein